MLDETLAKFLLWCFILICYSLLQLWNTLNYVKFPINSCTISYFRNYKCTSLHSKPKYWNGMCIVLILSIIWMQDINLIAIDVRTLSFRENNIKLWLQVNYQNIKFKYKSIKWDTNEYQGKSTKDSKILKLSMLNEWNNWT